MASGRAVPTLRLYVAGAGDQSLRAIRAFQSCAATLGLGERTEVIDAYRAISRAHEDGVVVLPTAVWCDGQGRRRIVGDVCDPERLLAAVSAAVANDRGYEASDNGAERSSRP